LVLFGAFCNWWSDFRSIPVLDHFWVPNVAEEELNQALDSFGRWTISWLELGDHTSFFFFLGKFSID